MRIVNYARNRCAAGAAGLAGAGMNVKKGRRKREE